MKLPATLFQVSCLDDYARSKNALQRNLPFDMLLQISSHACGSFVKYRSGCVDGDLEPRRPPSTEHLGEIITPPSSPVWICNSVVYYTWVMPALAGCFTCDSHGPVNNPWLSM